MRPHLFPNRARCLLWLIVAFFALPASVAQAGDITFKNETKINLVVQGATYLNRQRNLLKAGPSLKIKAGESGTDFNVPAPSRVIIITDALGRRLFMRELPYDGADCTVEIQTDPRTGGIVLRQVVDKKKKN